MKDGGGSGGDREEPSGTGGEESRGRPSQLPTADETAPAVDAAYEESASPADLDEAWGTYTSAEIGKLAPRRRVSSAKQEECTLLQHSASAPLSRYAPARHPSHGRRDGGGSRASSTEGGEGAPRRRMGGGSRVGATVPGKFQEEMDSDVKVDRHAKEDGVLDDVEGDQPRGPLERTSGGQKRGSLVESLTESLKSAKDLGGSSRKGDATNKDGGEQADNLTPSTGTSHSSRSSRSLRPKEPAEIAQPPLPVVEESNAVDPGTAAADSAKLGCEGGEAGRDSLTKEFNQLLASDENGSNDRILVQLKALAATPPADRSSSTTVSRFRPSLVNDFQQAADRESFQQRISTSHSTRGSEVEDAADEGGVDWPSPVSSLGSPPTVPRGERKESRGHSGEAAFQPIAREDNASSASKEDILLTARHEDVASSNAKAAKGSPPLHPSPTAGHKSTGQAGARRRSSTYEDEPSMDHLDFGDGDDETDSQDNHRWGALHASASSFDHALQKTNVGRKVIRDLRASILSGPGFQIDAEESPEPAMPSDRRDVARRRTSGASDVSSLDSYASPVLRVNKERSGSFSSLDSLASASEENAQALPSKEAERSVTPANDKLMEYAPRGADAPIVCGNLHRSPPGDSVELSSRGSVSSQPLTPDRRASHRLERRSSRDSSLSFGDLDGDDNANPFRASGLAHDVALHLEHSTKSLHTAYSSDGIDLIDPNATDEGREDFDYAMTAYTNAIKCGHFDFDSDTAFDESAAWEGDDEVLAARAYMGLGFARQIKGELESSLDAYTKALNVCEEGDPMNASIQYTIGTVLIEMQLQMEAVEYFTKALQLFKQRDPASDGGVRESILSTEGMLFSVLGEANRALDCFQKATLTFQSSNLSYALNLKFAGVMHELGSLLSQQGQYEAAATCFNFALEIRKALLGDSFLVARTHYSLGVTKAALELHSNSDVTSAGHLEEALRICQQEFDGDEHVQSAIIIHALGVLYERRGDFHAASVWFVKELKMRKRLFGEDHKTVAAVSSDLGTCYYNSGNYDLAISTFEDGLRCALLERDGSPDEVAEALYKIASCHDSLCNYDEALEKFYEVKKLRESLFGTGSSPVIQTMLRIGNLQLCKGEVKKAFDGFSEILDIGYASDSVNAVEVANALYGRGCAQLCGFHMKGAMKSFNQSLNWKLAALGENDPGLACIFYQMAHVHLEQSQPEEAITCFEEYSRLQKLEPQRNLHDNAEICYAEGIVAKLKGRQDLALSFYNQALAMFETLFDGGDHEKIASLHFDIGCAHAALNNPDAALGHFRTCLLQRKTLLGGHVDDCYGAAVAQCLFKLGSLSWRQQHYANAKKLFEEYIRIRAEGEGDPDEEMAQALTMMGDLQKETGEKSKAQINWMSATEIYQQLGYPDNHPKLSKLRARQRTVSGR